MPSSCRDSSFQIGCIVVAEFLLTSASHSPSAIAGLLVTLGGRPRELRAPRLLLNQGPSELCYATGSVVCVWMCLQSVLSIRMSCAKMVEPVEMPVGGRIEWTVGQGGTLYYIEVKIPKGKG